MRPRLLPLLLLPLLLAGCGGGDAIVDTWHAPDDLGTSLTLTKGGKWIAKNGPTTIEIDYKVESVAGNVYRVQLMDPESSMSDDREMVKATLTVDGDVMTVSDNMMFEGKWKR